MRYGTCYKGSKNGIAEWVYMHFPKLTNFYDLWEKIKPKIYKQTEFDF